MKVFALIINTTLFLFLRLVAAPCFLVYAWSAIAVATFGLPAITHFHALLFMLALTLLGGLEGGK